MTLSFSLEGRPHAALCDVVKLCGIADSGGQAKTLIAAGAVRRGGLPETRKTAKILAGEHLEITTDDGRVVSVAVLP